MLLVMDPSASLKRIDVAWGQYLLYNLDRIKPVSIGAICWSNEIAATRAPALPADYDSPCTSDVEGDLQKMSPALGGFQLPARRGGVFCPLCLEPGYSVPLCHFVEIVMSSDSMRTPLANSSRHAMEDGVALNVLSLKRRTPSGVDNELWKWQQKIGRLELTARVASPLMSPTA